LCIHECNRYQTECPSLGRIVSQPRRGTVTEGSPVRPRKAGLVLKVSQLARRVSKVSAIRLDVPSQPYCKCKFLDPIRGRIGDAILSQYVFTIGPLDPFAWLDQTFLFQCEAEVAMVAALHDRLRALELDVTLADFVGKSVVTGAK
jgi:hypothetical protein